MRKYFLIVLALTGIIFQFSSCEAALYTVLIENKSSKPVLYVYDGNSYTLASGESKTYDEIKAYTQPPNDINVPGAMSIKMENFQGERFTFDDVEGITLNVTNLLPYTVKLKADNYIDAGESDDADDTETEDEGDDSDDSKTEMKITANASATAKIYTAKPKFTTIPQCTVEWELDENVMDVIIK